MRFRTPAILDWASVYIHELTHFTDQIFFSQWIWANQFLINHGETSDGYFTEFVRLYRSNGKQIGLVQQDFFMTFAETRAYSAQLALLLRLKSKSGGWRVDGEATTRGLKKSLR